MNEPTKKCDNCDKEIAESKFILHERYCNINIEKCKICGEPVSKDELEDHKNESHKLLNCTDCGKNLEIRLMNSHKKKCSKKPSSCSYCELIIPKNELHDHEYMCGSKTELCHLCGQPIPIMEYDLHISYVCPKNDDLDHSGKKEIKGSKVNNINHINEINSKRSPKNFKTKGNNIENIINSKKQNFQEFNNNIEKLKREFTLANETIKNSAQVFNLKKKKNERSNNLEIKNKKMNDFLDKKEKTPPKKTCKTKEERNFSKNKFASPHHKKNGRKYQTIDLNDDNCENDILLAILEKSKQEK